MRNAVKARSALRGNTQSICILHQSHQAHIHMELLMAMKQAWTGIRGDQVHFHLAPGWYNHHILPYS